MSGINFRGLHPKIAVGVIGTILILSAAHFAWDYRFYRKQLYEEARESAKAVARVALNSLVQTAMLGSHPELLQGAVENLSRETEVQQVTIIDLEGQVRFASNPRILGRSYALTDQGCQGCHVNTTDPPQSQFTELEGQSILRHAEPVINQKQCQSCHSGPETSLGVLLVDFPTRKIQEKLEASRSEILVQAGLTLAAMLLVLGVIMNRVVISRIRKLSRLISEISPAGPPQELTQMEGKDEIGLLARSFREMSESLKVHCDEIEEKERLRISLLERLIHSQEEERRTISRELHDQLGQSLSALLLALQTKFGKARSSSSLESNDYRDIESRVSGLIDKVHRLAWQMRPSILDDYGLDMALKRFIEETSKNVDLKIDYQVIPPEGIARMPIWLEVTLYRIAQEGINNAVRHAQATNASVILMVRNSTVTLLIEDNGIGFEPEQTSPRSDHGLGLLGMRERAIQSGGTLDVESAPQQGTTIRVTIPLEQRTLWRSVPS